MAPVIFCPKVGTEIAFFINISIGSEIPLQHFVGIFIYFFFVGIFILSIFYATNFLIGCLLIDIN